MTSLAFVLGLLRGIGLRLAYTSLFGFGFFIGITAIVGLVKSRTLENKSGTCAEHAFHLTPASLLWTILQLGIAHSLENLKNMAALLTPVIVIGHDLF